MQENRLYKYSSSPHVKAPRTTRQIMVRVCIALSPAVIMGSILFGPLATLIIALSVLSAIASEFVFLLITKNTFKSILKQFDFTSFVTGLLIGLSVGVQTPLYVPVFASVFAIIVVKMLFGGTGKNLVNPAVTGRIFAFISFTAVMTGGLVAPNIGSLVGATAPSTGATILTGMLDKEAGVMPAFSNLDLLLGTGIMGCIGETCKVALLLGAIYLAIDKVINILYPLIYVAVTGLFSVMLGGFDFALFLPSILSGGLILGAFFKATDYTTTPNTSIGNVIYFVILGLVTAGLRKATGIEVVSFAILLMNLFVPLIDKFVTHKPFGFIKTKKTKENKNG